MVEPQPCLLYTSLGAGIGIEELDIVFRQADTHFHTCDPTLGKTRVVRRATLNPALSNARTIRSPSTEGPGGIKARGSAHLGTELSGEALSARRKSATAASRVPGR